MSFKISKLATVAIIWTLGSSTYAKGITHNGFEFYVGLSGGVNQMSGKRSENIFTIPDGVYHIFTNNLGFKDRNAQYAGFAGFSWYVPSTNIFIGPEIHIGKGHTERRFQEAVFDAGVPGTRTLDSSLTQSVLYGGVVRLGAYYHAYSGYVLIGGERSQFQNYVNYGPIDTPASTFKSNRWLNGLQWGLGIDKQIQCIRVGVEARFINYRNYQKQYDNSIQSNELVNVFFKPKNARVSLKLSYIF